MKVETESFHQLLIEKKINPQRLIRGGPYRNMENVLHWCIFLLLRRQGRGRWRQELASGGQSQDSWSWGGQDQCWLHPPGQSLMISGCSAGSTSQSPGRQDCQEENCCPGVHYQYLVLSPVNNEWLIKWDLFLVLLSLLPCIHCSCLLAAM